MNPHKTASANRSNSGPEFLEDTPATVPGSAVAPAEEKAPPTEEERERQEWRRRRFWDMFEPSRQVKFSTPELYVERFIARNILDPKINVFEIEATPVSEHGVRLTGKVLWTENGNGLVDIFRSLGFDPIESELRTLPDESLGTRLFGFVTTHTLAVRRSPVERAEQLDQAAFGDGVRLLELDESGAWYRVVANHGYVGWADANGIRAVDLEAWTEWKRFETWARILEPIRLVENGREIGLIPAASALPVLEPTALASAPTAIRGVAKPFLEAKPETSGQASASGNGDESEAGRRVEPVAGGEPSVRVALPYAAPNDRALLPERVVRRFDAHGDITREKIHRIANPLLGVPYVWGGVSERGVDCSGFSQYVYRMLGVALARDADEQSIGGRLVFRRGENYDNLLPGDLLFYINNAGRVSHVAVSLGGTEYVHSAGGRVHLASFDPESPLYQKSYTDKLAFAKRYFYSPLW